MTPFREKILSLGVLRGGRSRAVVQDVRGIDGRPVGKATTDELNNTVTEYAERQDVHLRPKPVGLEIRTKAAGS